MVLRTWTRQQLDPVAPSLGYGCCLEDLHCGFIHCSTRSASRVIGVSAYEQRTSPSPKTLVGRKETSTELSSSITCDPQFRVKMSSQRSQPPKRAAGADKGVGTDLTVARNPSILLASELTDCLAKRYLNRARCLALTVSGEKVVLSCIATDVAPRAGFSSGTVSLIAHNGLSAKHYRKF